MNVLVTGAAGFIGGFLVKHCRSNGCTVLGIDVKAPEDYPDGAEFRLLDVRDMPGLSGSIASFRPDRVFHLAAQSYPTVSMLKPAETMDINAGGTINLYEALLAAKLSPTVVIACSSAEYGLVDAKNLPVKEGHALLPLHPYGVSKVAQDLLAAQYFANYGIPSVRIRIFNTTGPSKTGDVCADLTRRAVEIERGKRPPIMLAGNLTTRRAIADVRDQVRGLWLAAERGAPGDVYNVGGNQIYSVQELIDAIRAHVRVPFSVEQDPALVRKCDEPVIACDTTKFRERSGWSTEIEIRQTIKDMIEWWQNRLASEEAADTAVRNR